MTISLRTTALGGLAGFVTAIAVATAVQPAAYDTTRDLVSGLAGRGASHPWIMMAGFEFMAVGLAAASVGLWRRFTRPSGRAAAVLVMIAAAAMAVAGLARFDCSVADDACEARLAQGVSTSAAVHGLAALFVFLPLIISAFLLAVAAGPATLGAGPRLRTVAVLGGLAGLLLILAVEEASTPIAGLLQRIDILPTFGLAILAAFAPLSERPRAPKPADPAPAGLATPALRDYPTARR
jgi:hypothetical protein